MSIPYRPANGTEGLDFNNFYCCHCQHGGDDGISCDIWYRSFYYELSNPEYPKEWISDDDGENPRCTAWVREGEK